MILKLSKTAQQEEKWEGWGLPGRGEPGEFPARPGARADGCGDPRLHGVYKFTCVVGLCLVGNRNRDR